MRRMNERIKKIRKSLGMTQKEFGETIGISRDVMANIENARVDPSESLIKLISITHNVSYDWLKYGEGEMYMDADDESIAAAIDEMMAGENETAKAVFRAFAKMDESDWAAIKKLILAISDDLKK